MPCDALFGQGGVVGVAAQTAGVIVVVGVLLVGLLCWGWLGDEGGEVVEGGGVGGGVNTGV